MSEEPISPLVADLITANMDQLNATTNTLIDSLTKQKEDLRAELDAVRAGIERLLSGWFQPSSAALHRALYPPAEFVDTFRPEAA